MLFDDSSLPVLRTRVDKITQSKSFKKKRSKEIINEINAISRLYPSSQITVIVYFLATHFCMNSEVASAILIAAYNKPVLGVLQHRCI